MPESIDQYELAATERLYDGLAIALTPGREQSLGSVYLFGYVIEMTLKAAFFRVIGTDPTTPVSMEAVGDALGGRRPGARQSHDLLTWLAALVSARAARDRALKPELAADLESRSRRAAREWSVDHRYDGSAVPHSVVSQMFDDASWFLALKGSLAG